MNKKERIIRNAQRWLKATHVKRTSEEKQAYLHALTDAEVEEDIVQAVEDEVFV